MATLSTRLQALEKRLDSMTVPKPYLVLFADNKDQCNFLASQYSPDSNIIFILTIDGRKES